MRHVPLTVHGYDWLVGHVAHNRQNLYVIQEVSTETYFAPHYAREESARRKREGNSNSPLESRKFHVVLYLMNQCLGCADSRVVFLLLAAKCAMYENCSKRRSMHSVCPLTHQTGLLHMVFRMLKQ